MKQDLIIILDLGSEDNIRPARAIRRLGVYSEIHPHDISRADLEAIQNLKGIIINGGKNNIVNGAPIDVAPWLADIGIPLLFVAHPDSISAQAASNNQSAPLIRAMHSFPENDDALDTALSSFVFNDCQSEANWNMENFIDDQVASIRSTVGDKQVLLALSGGVDSSVVAALLIKAIGKQLRCVHVNHGLMRKDESKRVIDVFERRLGAHLTYVDAVERFLEKLAGVSDPEEKRKIIGTEFIRVFEEEAAKLGKIDYLAQGTIYPDVIESGTKTAPVIKSHHNVGGLPDDMAFELIEPLKYLFKDEVRACGTALGLPDSMVYAQPFPGPGLGIRCLGAITRDRLEAVRESDAILREEIALAGLDRDIWQYFTVVPEFKSVGMKDGVRTYQCPVIIRAINSVLTINADVPRLDWALLERITNRILEEVPEVNRVLYDLSPKPPATMEWE